MNVWCLCYKTHSRSCNIRTGSRCQPRYLRLLWMLAGKCQRKETRKLIFWLRCVKARKICLFLPQNDCQSWIPKWRKMDCEVERLVHTHRTRITRYIQRPQRSNVSSKFWAYSVHHCLVSVTGKLFKNTKPTVETNDNSPTYVHRQRPTKMTAMLHRIHLAVNHLAKAWTAYRKPMWNIRWALKENYVSVNVQL